MISPNFESPVYEAEEEENEEIPDEISRLLEQERKTIQPYGEALEVINLTWVPKRTRKRSRLERHLRQASRSE